MCCFGPRGSTLVSSTNSVGSGIDPGLDLVLAGLNSLVCLLLAQAPCAQGLGRPQQKIEPGRGRHLRSAVLILTRSRRAVAQPWIPGWGSSGSEAGSPMEPVVYSEGPSAPHIHRGRPLNPHRETGTSQNKKQESRGKCRAGLARAAQPHSPCFRLRCAAWLRA